MLTDLNSWDELRVQARHLIKAGRLPGQFSRDISGCFGSDNSCTLCGHPITRLQVEIQVLLGPIDWLALHVLCYRAWHDESIEEHHVIRRSAAKDSGEARELEKAARGS